MRILKMRLEVPQEWWARGRESIMLLEREARAQTEVHARAERVSGQAPFASPVVVAARSVVVTPADSSVRTKRHPSQIAGVAQHFSPRSLVANVVQLRPTFTTLKLSSGGDAGAF